MKLGALQRTLPQYVTKRNGRLQPFDVDKITRRCQVYSTDLDNVKPELVAQKVASGLTSDIKVQELDKLICETAFYMSSSEPQYDKLASGIFVSNLWKETKENYLELVEELYAYVNPKTNPPRNTPLVSDELMIVVRTHHAAIQEKICYQRDYDFDYFGLKTLERGYLIQKGERTMERPQHMWMRVALGIWGHDLENAFATYDMLSLMQATHATPTLFNAGTQKPQCSSCFLLEIPDDSIDGICEADRRCSKISQFAGGIGLSIHRIRAKGAYIAGTNGRSNGLVPMLQCFNARARYVDQGGGKRKGAFSIYMEPWHADIFEVLELKKQTGKEELRARDLFYGMWVPDLFMERVESEGKWSLFCPTEAPGLAEVYGQEFNDLYERYEREGRARRTIEAMELFFAICTSQMETGGPYMVYKDAANRKSNHSHLGTLKNSNLCTEIMQYVAPDQIAVCNLASICLPKCLKKQKDGALEFDHYALRSIVWQLVKNLDRIIDINFYPLEEARRSNMMHRPKGIGPQGLWDVFMMLRMPYESQEARALNLAIAETIYFSALEASCKLAEEKGCYPSYPGSPISKGILQCDMWGVVPSDRWDWANLRQQIAKWGVRSSLLVAPMPTASTSQIMGNTECFQPPLSNIYSRRVLAGDFYVTNKYLYKDLKELGLWTPTIVNEIKRAHGSIQGIEVIPQHIRMLYKTTWEIKQRRVIDLAADRGAFTDQSQSLNIHLSNPTFKQVSSMHFHGWRSGLKTGMYYLKSQPATDPTQFTVDTSSDTKQSTNKEPTNPDPVPPSLDASQDPVENAWKEAVTVVEGPVCRKGDDGCLTCSS